jgi:hypothetical protein
VIESGTSGYILVGAGIGVAPVWGTELTSLTKVTVDNITIDAATIVSDTGAISFSDENLTTTGSGTFNFLDIPEITPPGSPAAAHLRLYVEDFKGFSIYSFIDNTGMVRKIVRDSVFVARNMSGSTIPANRAVYASGHSEGVPAIDKARANSVNTMPAIGVTLESIAHEAYGRVMQVGLVENVDTSSFSSGDILYVSSTVAGILVATAPLYPNIRQEIGTILVDDATAGTVQVVARSMFNEGILDHGGLLGLADDDHTQYLLADGSRDLTGNMLVDAAITIDGRDLSVDGTKLDGIEALADVTDATNVAAAGAAMAGGAFHNGFSDFVANEHIDHSAVSVSSGTGLTGGGTIDGNQTLALSHLGIESLTDPGADRILFWDDGETAAKWLQVSTGLTLFGTTLTTNDGGIVHNNLSGYESDRHIAHSVVTITAGSGLTGGGDITLTRTLDLDINKLSVATIAAGDFIPFWDITATATNKKITFANLEGTLNHGNLAGLVAAEHVLLPNTIANVLSDHTRANHIGLELPADTLASAWFSGDLSLASDTTTTVTLNAERFDLGSDFNTGTYQYTVPETGYYFISISARINGIGAGEWARIWLENQSATILAYAWLIPSGVGDTLLEYSNVISLTSGDVLTMYARQNNAAARNMRCDYGRGFTIMRVA